MRRVVLLFSLLAGCGDGEVQISSIEVKIEMPIRCYSQGIKSELVLAGTVSSTGTLDSPILAQLTQQAGIYVRRGDGRICTIGYGESDE